MVRLKSLWKGLFLDCKPPNKNLKPPGGLEMVLGSDGTFPEDCYHLGESVNEG